MKQGIHPEYREVVFVDTSSDFKFLTRSTIDTNETIEWEDGNTYPMVRVEISSATVLAAALRLGAELAGKRVGVVLTGGNVDLDALPF